METPAIAMLPWGSNKGPQPMILQKKLQKSDRIIIKYFIPYKAEWITFRRYFIFFLLNRCELSKGRILFLYKQILLRIDLISLPERSSGRAIILPPAWALANC